jgi:chromosome segregation ATPase
MPDPMGTVGAPRVAPESDLSIASRGGPKFMDRISQLAEASDRHEQALANLKLGQDVIAAHAEARRKLADADAKLAEAEKVIAQAEQAKRDADAYAADARSKADALVNAAKDKLVAAEGKQSEAEATIERYNAAKAETERATEAANDRHAQLQSKIDRLHSVINDVSA